MSFWVSVHWAKGVIVLLFDAVVDCSFPFLTRCSFHAPGVLG
jgi:hypothetical protein